MKKILIYTVLLFILKPAFAQQPEIIPLPNNFNRVDANFILSANIAINVQDEELGSLAWFFQKEVLRYTGITLPLKVKEGSKTIRFKKKVGLEDEEYKLEMSDRLITISSSTDNGAFNGAVSLLQLIRNAAVKDNSVSINCWNINDSPRYTWRGLMLDESRHFFGKEKVKSILDWMAFYKLNRFHWHLTDQHGWRIEIKQYPRLGLVGGVGNYSDPDAPSKYYSHEDITEIVTYAKERHITVVPEIDMPGHATAANLAYPEFSGGGSKNYPEFTFNPGKDATYNYLSRILKETDVLFPSQMIHLGGDEVHFGNEKWNTDMDVKLLMQNKGLKDLKSVEHYFIRRMADTVIELNNKILGWDEVVDTNLPVSNTIVFWWRHDKPQQLRQALDKGYQVVLCPRLPLYFDFVQDSIHKFGRKWKGDYNSLEKVYQFSSESIPETNNKSKLILGIQANLWTETVSTVQRLDYLLFPRICALAEAAWTEQSKKNFKQFDIRLKTHFQYFSKAGIYFYDFRLTNKYSEPSPGLKKFDNTFLD